MPDRSPHTFQTTHWSQVVAARGDSQEARQALRSLCEAYYEPVALFIRRTFERSPRNALQNETTGSSSDDSRDLTHEFFAKLLEGHSLDQVDRTRGRFRSYLLGAVKHFLADHCDRERTLKRGGKSKIYSLTNRNAEDALGADPRSPIAPDAFPPDAYFDRLWGLTVIQQAIDALRGDAKRSGEIDRFEILRHWLVTPSGDDSATQAAQSLNLSASAFKVAVHRLRKKFRHIVVTQISATIDDPADVADELDYLITAVTFETQSDQ